MQSENEQSRMYPVADEKSSEERVDTRASLDDDSRGDYPGKGSELERKLLRKVCKQHLIPCIC